MRALSDNVLEAPNVADTALFARALEPGPVDAALQILPQPRIVFTGAVVRTKLDFDLIAQLARREPDWTFALVGPAGAGDPTTDLSALRAAPNIHLLGRRAYADLPDVLRGADAGIIPYARNELTTSIFPMKVYEYLAAGLPVVTTPLPSLQGVEGVVAAADAESMLARLKEALATDSDDRRVQRSRLAAAHSWDARLEEIGRAVAPWRRGGVAAARGGGAIRGRAVSDLLVTTHIPTLDSGRALRTYGIARALAAHPDRGRVVADGPTVAAALRSLIRRRPVIYNAHNLESAFRHDVDARGLGLRRGPNVVDVRRIVPRSSHPGDRRSLFLADFTYAPNRRGLEFLLEDVYPRVWKELPDAELILAGRGLERVPARPQVTYLGYVEGVAAAYALADCALAPLRDGGSPLKFIEALAYGLPVIATPCAARGLDVRAGEHFLQGDDAAGFASQVLRTLRDGAPDVAARGRALVEADYSIEALTRAIAG